MKKKFASFFATWFYSGLLPKAPGTFGSIASLPLAYIVHYFYGFSGLAIAILAVFTLGYWSIYEVTKDSKDKDLQKIVIDETLGILVTFFVVSQYLKDNIWLYLVGFLLFRFFDIWKTGLVKYFDNKNSILGVMLDDFFAGLYAGIILYVVCYIIYL